MLNYLLQAFLLKYVLFNKESPNWRHISGKLVDLLVLGGLNGPCGFMIINLKTVPVNNFVNTDTATKGVAV